MTKHRIVLIPFPFDDLSSTKVRPALCLTDPIGSHKHVILAFITSRVSASPLASDIVINADNPDFSETGLRVSSMLQLHRLMTVTTTMIRRDLGTLPLALRPLVNACLHRLLD